MKIEEAKRIIDMLSSQLRMKDGINENHLLNLAIVIREFELEKDFPFIRNLYRKFDRDPRDAVTGYSLVLRLKKIFEFYLLDDDPFIPRPSNGEVDGEIRIAKCTSGNYFGRERIEYCQHEAISGRSGCGKSTIQFHTFDAMNKIGVKCIVISSVKRIFRKLIRNFPNTLVIRCGAPDETFKFNPFQLPDGANINQVKAMFTRCFSESEQVYIGTENYISSHLTALFEQEDNPTFRELLLRIQKDKPNYKEPRKMSYKDSALGRLIPMNNTLGNMFNCRKGYPILEILKSNNIILEEDSLNPSEKQFINSLFLVWLFSSLICQNFRTTELRYLVIIDEGHDVFNHRFGQISNPIILTFLQVVREAGIGVSIGCQNPAYIDGRVFGNMYTRILMNSVEGTDIKKCVDSMGFQTKQEIQEIYKLKVGEAIVRMARYPRLFRVKTEPYDLDVSVSDAEVIENNTRILSNYNYVPLPSDVIVIDEVPKSDEKKEREEKKEKVKDAQIQLSNDQKKLLIDVYTRPYESVNKKLRSLSFSGSRGDRLKKSLIEQGYVAEYPMKLGEGRGKRGKILILQDKADAVIEPSQKLQYGKGANLHHSFIQQILKRHFENLWHVKAEIEMIRNGKAVDIGIITNDSCFIAVEFENTLAHVKQNLVKDLESGFQRVITICETKRMFEQTKEIIETEFQSEKQRIIVCMLSEVLLGSVEF